MKTYYFFSCLCFVLMVSVLGTGCNKFLEEKPNSKLAIIDEVHKAQALLDDHRLINEGMPSLGTASADEVYLRQNDFNAMTPFEREAYLWSKTGVMRPSVNEWISLFAAVYKCNVVLWSLEQMDKRPGTDSAMKATRGHALLLRGYYYLLAAQIWCNAYDEMSADSDLGLPLRTTPDFENNVVRSNLRQTYVQILADLKESAGLLPDIPLHEVRPSKPAAYAFLARTYLYMRQYDSAGHYAQLCLEKRNGLYDYNSIPNPAANFPFAPRYSHPETIMHFA